MKRLGIDGAATIRRVALGVSSRMVFVVFMLGTALLTYSDDSVAEMDRLVSYLVYGAAVIGVAAAETARRLVGRDWDKTPISNVPSANA
ncbi:hypothetical protein [Schleiferilactobacillus harbinensis]|uniref:Holin n=2 Tax=Schleiferilactobacillus harbinensis TaxID=304207 RepID=A0ABU7T1U4_9LACO|nr:hypothetical protein [Schleiferilactobacillus harbinensis]QEU48591.1 hypothetical protein FMM01_15395 [Schleiferilactobacillus harbinensis]